MTTNLWETFALESQQLITSEDKRYHGDGWGKNTPEVNKQIIRESENHNGEKGKEN